MRACLGIRSVVALAMLLAATLLATAPLAAQTPAPANTAVDSPPADLQAKRNWLLARLIVDRHLSGAELSATEQKLANMSPDQLDVLAQVYQQKRSEQAAAAGTELQLAQENLQQLKNTRDALAGEVQSWRNFRQAQYVNYGLPLGVYGYSGYGVGGIGLGVGYGAYGGYGGYGYPYAPYAGYPNFAPAPIGASPYYAGYGSGAYGVAYPMFGGSAVGYGVGVY